MIETVINLNRQYLYNISPQHFKHVALCSGELKFKYLSNKEENAKKSALLFMWNNFNMSSLVTYLYVISGPNINLEEAVGKYELWTLSRATITFRCRWTDVALLNKEQPGDTTWKSTWRNKS